MIIYLFFCEVVEVYPSLCQCRFELQNCRLVPGLFGRVPLGKPLPGLGVSDARSFFCQLFASSLQFFQHMPTPFPLSLWPTHPPPCQDTAPSTARTAPTSHPLRSGAARRGHRHHCGPGVELMGLDWIGLDWCKKKGGRGSKTKAIQKG